jgi:molybdopterin converting factor subunit 1
MQVNVKYFAALREVARIESEIIQTNASNAAELYKELKEKYSFKLDETNLKVAINEQYEEFDTTLKNNDVVVFIPPVAGG